MKKDFFSIEDLAQGKCAVVNDGTFEELMNVFSRLNLTRWDECCIFHARYSYVFKNEDGEWGASNNTTLPTQSVKDFLHDFKVGDLVTTPMTGGVFVIESIRNGVAKITAKTDEHFIVGDILTKDLTPYYKKGDKAEVVEDFTILGLKKGDIIQFTDDNVVNGFRLSDAVLKNGIKRIRSGTLEHDVSCIELKTLKSAKKAIDNAPTTTINSNWVEATADNILFRKAERHSHYNNEKGSLYKIAEQLGLNTYEFDILKRISRCRKKGQFKQDLQKIKDTVDLYLKEVEHD